jgi:hypothetical protein
MSMEQRPLWEANSHSASQEIARLLCKPKVYYRVHKSPPLVSILSKMNTVHNIPPCFPKIHSNIILPSMPRSYEWSLLFRISSHNIISMSPYVLHAPPISSSLTWSTCIETLLVAEISWRFISSKTYILINSVFYVVYPFAGSLNSPVGIGVGYGLDDRGSILGRGWEFFSSPPHPDRFWAHPASYPMGTGCSFPRGKGAGARSWLLTSI